MRTMAAVRLQQAQAALPGMRAFADVMAGALADALLFFPGGALPAHVAGTPGVVLFASEHGFVGGFVRELIEALPREPHQLFVVGTRGVAVCTERGLAIAASAPMATRPAAVAETVSAIAEPIAARFAAGTLCTAEVMYARHERGGRRTIVRRRVLPPEHVPRSERPRPPHTYLGPDVLVERVMLEAFFAELAHASMESFASEAAASLNTMESARQAIREKIDELRGEQRRLRQEQITEQILERVSASDL
jgi:F-type H+-transporting ATPase subunit gamma